MEEKMRMIAALKTAIRQGNYERGYVISWNNGTAVTGFRTIVNDNNVNMASCFIKDVSVGRYEYLSLDKDIAIRHARKITNGHGEFPAVTTVKDFLTCCVDVLRKEIGL
jgi:hypothetical protein